jgi:hypothetical protein
MQLREKMSLRAIPGKTGLSGNTLKRWPKVPDEVSMPAYRYTFACEGVGLGGLTLLGLRRLTAAKFDTDVGPCRLGSRGHRDVDEDVVAGLTSTAILRDPVGDALRGGTKFTGMLCWRFANAAQLDYLQAKLRRVRRSCLGHFGLLSP